MDLYEGKITFNCLEKKLLIVRYSINDVLIAFIDRALADKFAYCILTAFNKLQKARFLYEVKITFTCLKTIKLVCYLKSLIFLTNIIKRKHTKRK